MSLLNYYPLIFKRLNMKHLRIFTGLSKLSIPDNIGEMVDLIKGKDSDLIN